MTALIWRRLDAPGHDACRLQRDGAGWRLEGTAIFVAAGTPACLSYHVACDDRWRTRSALVTGWAGAAEVRREVAAVADGWALDGTVAPGLAACTDIDLAFTPATNVIPLRRLALRPGQSAGMRSAWLRYPELDLVELVQTYACRAAGIYDYASPQVGYSGVLKVNPDGFVTDYPGLWAAET